ncbi:MAG: isocitrate/isopropylmalate dehydrogenase family protein [candidate division Zixibacteria bacterium]|nr:isocitrate/isopropylmalate dehydrogenase family protein [candidate division Zixibacteria bacterium]
MAKYKIAWLPGDGIGVDVMDAAKIVLDKLHFDAEYIHGDIGWEFWSKEGNPLPDRTVTLLKNTDCALFGAITSLPKQEAEAALVPALQGKGLVYASPIVRMRQEFDLRTNLRPCKAYPGNPLNYKEGIDIVVFRENTEDLYSGVEFFPLPDEVRSVITKHNKKMARFDKHPADEIAISLRINTKTGCRNIITDAFEFAKKTGRKSVTVVEKPNVIRETSGLMVRTAREVAKKYPDIQLWETNIDAMCMWLVKNPNDYSVLVTSNMFGDIISDLAAQLVGGLGFASSGNIGDNYAVFEPTHGSAPKYAGQNKVNPIATFLSAVLMLDWLGETSMATRLENAIAAVIKEGKVRTYDMGGKSTTTDVANAVASKL